MINCVVFYGMYFLQGDFDDEQQSSLPDPSCGYVDMFMHHIPVMNMQSQVEIELVYLSHSKCCSTELPLRAELICAALMHGYLISLHSEYEPCP